jgi:osmotically-inducible protein OsmY
MRWTGVQWPKEMNLKIILSVLSLGLFGSALASEKLTSDDAIYDYVRRKLASDQIVKGGGLQVEVHQGAVTLRGTVEEQKQKERAAKLAKKIAGVKSVDNQLTVVQRSDKK